MSDLYLISDDLRALSRSAVEIILPYDAAVKAVSQVRAKCIALLGWEGLIVSATGGKYPSVLVSAELHR